MDKYLVEILKAFNTIIIPGLGALNLTNSETGECLFMPYLKYDDGKLSEYISETEGMSDNDAKNLIAKYVREIEAKLNVGESYDMYQFGSFIKNSSGDIEFNSWNKERTDETPAVEQIIEQELTPADTVVVEKVTMTEIVPEKIKKPRVSRAKVQPIHELKVEQEKPTSDNIIDKEAVIVDEEIIPIQENKLPVEEPIILENTSVTENTKEPEKKETPAYSEADQWADDLDVPPLNVKIERPKKPIIEKIKKDKKRKSPVFYALLIVGVLLVGGSLTLTLFFNRLEKFLPFIATETTSKAIEDNPKKDSEIKTSNESIDDEKQNKNDVQSQENQTTIEENNDPIKEEITSVSSVDKSNSFHIIGGAFMDKSNADRYQNRLVSEGNQSAIIGQFDNLYIVSIASFSSIEAANNALSGARSISSKAWVFKWP